MLTDGLGNPLHFLLSSGNRNDICLAREILEPFELTGKLVLADKGYDSDKFIRWIKERGGIPVIQAVTVQGIRGKRTGTHTKNGI